MNWLSKHLGGHISIGPVTIYGFNAMHVAVNVSTRWGYLCFHPTIRMGRKWPWYFYISRNGTPSIATFAIGPGISRDDKKRAELRRQILGFRFRVDDFEYTDLLYPERLLGVTE